MRDARVNNLGGLLTRTARLFPSHYAVIAEEKKMDLEGSGSAGAGHGFCLKKSRN